jgi:DNA-binding NarL/FixJ family response regulator
VEAMTSGRPGQLWRSNNHNLPLSPRQRECVALAAQGKTNREICAELGLCMAVVKAHLADAYKRMSVRNRVEATLKYIAGDLPTGVPHE